MAENNPREAILDHLELRGKRVADIGCGDGTMGRIMAARGAHVAKGEERTRKFEALEAELREMFERLGTRRDDGWYFDQPMRINLLRKTG